MMEMLEKDIEAGNRQLLALPYDDLRDKEGLNLRDYQIKAIQAAEKAIMDGHRQKCWAENKENGVEFSFTMENNVSL